MQEKTLQKTLDNLLKTAEMQIDGEYTAALNEVIRRNKAVFREIKAIMDGEIKPPRHLIFDRQKRAWAQKRLLKLLDDSGLIREMAASLSAAGAYSVTRIKRFGVATYKTAYSGVDEQLRG